MDLLCFAGDQSKLIKLSSQPNSQPPVSQNLGIRSLQNCLTADGRFVLFSDSGVVWKSDCTANCDSLVSSAFSHTAQVGCICASEGDSLALASYADGLCRLVNTTTDSVVWQWEWKDIKGAPTACAINLIAQYAAVGCSNGSIGIVDCETQTLHRTVSAGEYKGVKRLGFSNHSINVLGSATDDFGFHLWDINSSSVLKTFPFSCKDFAFSPNATGKIAAVIGNDRGIRVIDVTDYSKAQLSVRRPEALGSVALHQDGKHAALGTMDGNVLLFDLRKGLQTPLKKVPVFENCEVKRIAFRPTDTKKVKSSRSSGATSEAGFSNGSMASTVSKTDSPVVRCETPSDKENRPDVIDIPSSAAEGRSIPRIVRFSEQVGAGVSPSTDFPTNLSGETWKEPRPLSHSTVKASRSVLSTAAATASSVGNWNNRRVAESSCQEEDSILQEWPSPGNSGKGALLSPLTPSPHAFMVRPDLNSPASSISPYRPLPSLLSSGPSVERSGLLSLNRNADVQNQLLNIVADGGTTDSPVLNPNSLSKRLVQFEDATANIPPLIEEESAADSNVYELSSMEAPPESVAAASTTPTPGWETPGETKIDNNFTAAFIRNTVKEELEDQLDPLRLRVNDMIGAMLIEFLHLKHHSTQQTQLILAEFEVNAELHEENDRLRAENEELRRLAGNRRFV